MKLPKELTTVTPVSKSLAMFLFIILPLVAFFVGETYQATIDQYALQDFQPATGQPHYMRLMKTNPISPTMSIVPTEPVFEPYTKTTSVPSNWNAYSNLKYQLNINYPPNWRVSDQSTGYENNDSHTPILLDVLFEPASSQGFLYNLEVTKQNLPEAVKDLKDSNAQAQTNSPDTTYKILDEKYFLYEGHEATRMDFNQSYKNLNPDTHANILTYINTTYFYVFAHGYAYKFQTNYNSNYPVTQTTLQTIMESINVD